MRDYCTGGEVRALVGGRFNAVETGEKIKRLNESAMPGQLISFHYRRNKIGGIFDIQVHYHNLSKEWRDYLHERAPFKSLSGL